MVADDGHKFVFVRGSKRLIPCSRWAELTEFLKFHAGLSIASSAVCEFRLLNRSDFVRIGQGDEKENERYESLISLLNGSPGGGTPLCKHIREVTEEIKKVQHDLKIASQKACIIIATDGESSDGDILEALRPLRDLPAWVVIRLCTEEEKVVNYWNNIDKVLELDMLVLNDLRSEARAIFKCNPWLTYGEPLHRLREFGIPVKEIDLLDEVLLSPDQIRLFCHFLFGGSEDCYPNPVSHWQKFTE